MDPLVAHQRAQDAFAGVLANVNSDQLDAPTPCAEWKIRDLIEHVVGGNEYVGELASRQETPSRSDEVMAAHRAAAAAVQEAFAGPDGMDNTFKLPFGQVPGRVFIGIRTTDVLTHA